MDKVTLKITRGNPNDGETVMDYDVPYSEGMSLLEAVLWTRAHHDPSLAVRYSCRSANACKECSAIIDGKPGYLCNTKAQKGALVNVAPLRSRTWIRDLVTEID
ncbi:2Fe-2S iron-sulfur cluster-binding protein [Alicyclobacillus dauci]|uniref:2Fe-2S iron-sulfur cluster-binding protein n=1 Tax=Alicyclobacillus dauci TaxID=1475485 RepID=A0ABY6Z932_9BACL|nr:2Fe-2S iron-sulfur cluster-binding protein [Alicyclobacillus dauci]WAH38766.1 2Fe-2S iron-sulfur cluster-binding protein [Alicyclobacillus dauci]